MGGRGSSSAGGSASKSSGVKGKGGGIPNLSGSEKQISYARDLITKTYSALEAAEKEMEKIAPSKQAMEMARSNLNAMRGELRGMTEASDVINTLKDVGFSGNVEYVLDRIASRLNERYIKRQSRK